MISTSVKPCLEQRFDKARLITRDRILEIRDFATVIKVPLAVSVDATIFADSKSNLKPNI